MAYYLLIEGMAPEQKQEIDDLLEGPAVKTRTQRAADMAAIGGQVVPSRRKVTVG